MPFGGVGASGYGKYHGKAGFDALSHFKPVINAYPINVWPLTVRYPPFTSQKIKNLKLLMKFGDIYQSTVLKVLTLGGLAYFIK
jgi:hypothetical protein